MRDNKIDVSNCAQFVVIARGTVINDFELEFGMAFLIALTPRLEVRREFVIGHYVNRKADRCGRVLETQRACKSDAFCCRSRCESEIQFQLRRGGSSASLSRSKGGSRRARPRVLGAMFVLQARNRAGWKRVALSCRTRGKRQAPRYRRAEKHRRLKCSAARRKMSPLFLPGAVRDPTCRTSSPCGRARARFSISLSQRAETLSPWKHFPEKTETISRAR